MIPPLTQVPATLPGVVRRGTPVTLIDSPEVYAPLRGLRLTVDRVGDGYAWFNVLGSESGLPLSWLAVDLDDATGRAHAAGAILGAPVATWTCEQPEGAWKPSTGADWRYYPHDVYPFLADLDPYTGHRLPDGSRWVDAEALARVLLHVLGGAS